MDVKQFQGMTLQEIEDRIRVLGHEELFVIGKDGSVLAAYRGNSNSVAFYSSDLMRRGATVTHGHPKGAEGYGATFSLPGRAEYGRVKLGRAQGCGERQE